MRPERWIGLQSFGCLCWCGCFCCLLGVLFCWGLGGCTGIALCMIRVSTNHQNSGLISVDRRTSLLSHVQYPVPYQSRLQRIYCSSCRKGEEGWCSAEAYRYAKTLRAMVSSPSSIDSDLEAFSHYPADDSFGALAVQPTP